MRPGGGWKLVTHARDDLEARVWNRGGEGRAVRQRNERIGVAQHDARGSITCEPEDDVLGLGRGLHAHQGGLRHREQIDRRAL